MIIGVSVCELHLPEVRSLKEKRRVIKALIDRIYRRYRVSVAETDFNDLHQRAEIAIAAVGRNESEVQRLMQNLEGMIDQHPGAVLTHWQPQYLDGV